MSNITAASLSEPRRADSRLRSDLAVYCLPQTGEDDARKLAWANSICLLFVLVAFSGLRQPIFVIRPIPPIPEPMRAELVPAINPPPPPDAISEEPLEEEVVEEFELPAIEPVSVAEPREVSFPVPIEGFIQLVPNARFVPPPPPIIPKAPPVVRTEFRVLRFGDKAFRKQPPPNYPDEFQRNRIGGTVEALISVDTNGVPQKVEVGRSSGAPSLDRHVCEFIRREWRAVAGESANYRIAITFSP